jgi:hypothetical protein
MYMIRMIEEVRDEHAEGLSEADLNPIMVLPAGDGVRIVDALLVGRSPR